MLKRLLLALFLTMAPVAVHADDATTDPVPVDTPADMPAPTATPTPDPNAALGGSPINSGAGGSTGDSVTLQPAGNSPLQATTGDANGLTAPSANTLQQQASSDYQLQVLSTELDGHRVDPNATTDNSHWWIWLAVAIGLLISALSWADPVRRRWHHLRRRRH
jgi:hypothetical protein